MRHPFLFMPALAGALACAAVTAAPASNETALVPGVEQTVALPASGTLMKVCLPANHSADGRWPAILYYPPQGEDADTTLMRRFTGNRDYVVAGLPYGAGDDRARTPQEQAAVLQDRLAALREARTWLVTHAGVDEGRLILAGASKGGAIASALGERELPRLGGLILLLAGRQAGHGSTAVAIQNVPVYIGAGESDPNLIPARRAREFYKRNGALVSFEEYPGRVHEIPLDAPRLRAWLQVQGRCRQGATAPAARKEAAAEFGTLVTTALAGTEPLAQYRQLLELAEDPRLRLCEASLRQQMKTRFTELTQTAPARDEWLAETAFSDLIYREDGLRRLAEMKAVLDGFAALVRDYPDTRFGRLAAAYVPRLEQAYEKSLEATRNASENQPRPPPKVVRPTFPTSTLGQEAMPIPVRKGNKITFGPQAGR